MGILMYFRRYVQHKVTFTFGSDMLPYLLPSIPLIYSTALKVSNILPLLFTLCPKPSCVTLQAAVITGLREALLLRRTVAAGAD